RRLSSQPEHAGGRRRRTSTSANDSTRTKSKGPRRTWPLGDRQRRASSGSAVARCLAPLSHQRARHASRAVCRRGGREEQQGCEKTRTARNYAGGYLDAGLIASAPSDRLFRRSLFDEEDEVDPNLNHAGDDDPGGEII